MHQHYESISNAQNVSEISALRKKRLPLLLVLHIARQALLLEVPLNLGTKQPAIVRLGIGCWTESAGIATFLDRSG
jgi:hypothetical protein